MFCITKQRDYGRLVKKKKLTKLQCDFGAKLDKFMGKQRSPYRSKYYRLKVTIFLKKFVTFNRRNFLTDEYFSTTKFFTKNLIF